MAVRGMDAPCRSALFHSIQRPCYCISFLSTEPARWAAYAGPRHANSRDVLQQLLTPTIGRRTVLPASSTMRVGWTSSHKVDHQSMACPRSLSTLHAPITNW